MVPLTITEPAEVGNALSSYFGLSGETLLDVVWRMVGVRRDCTSNYPAGAQPILAYHAGTERLRSVTASFGYERNDKDQIESALHTKLGVKIVVVNTDEGTGLEEHSPRNVSGKGSATKRTVNSAQRSFIDVLDGSMPVIQLRPKGYEQGKDAISFWYLCVYETTDTVRAEISQPKSLTGDFFFGFHRRIILIGREGIGLPIERREDPRNNSGDTLEFNIPVTRK